MSKATTGARTAAVAAAGALLLAACGGSSGGSSSSGGATPSEGSKGGDLTFLTQGEQLLHLDPQRVYTGEDQAFLGATMTRTLTWYTPSADDKTAGQLLPDLATDTGKASNDNKTWAFTLKDGLKYEDGSAVTCEDVKYGVSRTFATDVITDGPTYAISYLDVPKAKDGSSVYKGPYKGDGQADYDKAVTCDGQTITFNLSKPVPDFNYTVTLQAFSPVPESADKGEKYDARPMSTGPYKIETNAQGKELKLVRNDQYSEATDTIRKAYPDTQTIKFGLTSSVLTQRLMADNAEDQAAMMFGPELDPSNLATVFNSPQYEARRFDGLTIYVRYYAINTTKVTNPLHRLALQAALPRADIKTIAGGNFAGDFATTSVSPTLASAFAPTDMYSNLDGKYDVGDNGDPEVAKTLIQESKEPMPTINFQYGKTETADKIAGAIVTAYEKAGIKIKPNPIDPGAYYGIVLDDSKAGEMMSGGWGADWANGSTVIPELFTPVGGFNLSRYDDAAFTKKVQEASVMGDLAAQGKAWAELDAQAMKAGTIMPTRYDKQQRLAGSKVGGAYLWAPFGSWGYPSLFVNQ